MTGRITRKLWPAKSQMGKLAKKANELQLAKIVSENNDYTISRGEILELVHQISEDNPYRMIKSGRWYEEAIRRLIRTVVVLERRRQEAESGTRDKGKGICSDAGGGREGSYDGVEKLLESSSHGGFLRPPRGDAPPSKRWGIDGNGGQAGDPKPARRRKA
jgi:hypothetical protein